MENSNLDAIDFKNFLINEVPRSLKDHISGYQVNLADEEDVKEAAGLIQSCYPPSPNAIFLKVKNFFHFEQKAFNI